MTWIKRVFPTIPTRYLDRSHERMWQAVWSLQVDLPFEFEFCHNCLKLYSVLHMSTQAIIEQRITDSLKPMHLEVINESHMHNVPPGSESHFKVTVVSEEFEGKILVSRHRMINDVLARELEGPIHALALHTMTPDEWFNAGGKSADSPQCLGGSNANK